MEIFSVIAGTLGRVFGKIATPYIKSIWYRIRGEKFCKRGKPKYEGVISSIADYKKLSNFIAGNDEGIVFLDLTMDDNSFRGDTESTAPYFVAFEDCFEELEEGEKPSIFKCTGTQFNVHISHVEGSCFFYSQRGFIKLRGYFVITGYSGPYQGLMDCNLRGVRHEDIKV